jgi:hypothetical protein
LDFPEFSGSGESAEEGKNDDWAGAHLGAEFAAHWQKTLTEDNAWFGEELPEPAPDTAFHTYTTEFLPGKTSGKYVERVYIDGKPKLLGNAAKSCWIGSCRKYEWEEVTPSPWSTTHLGLVLGYALRKGVVCNEEGVCPDFKETGQTRSFYTRSVAVYEDTPHKGIGITNGGLAPGTTEE